MTSLLHPLLALTGVLAGAAVLFLLITRRVRAAMDDIHD